MWQTSRALDHDKQIWPLLLLCAKLYSHKPSSDASLGENVRNRVNPPLGIRSSTNFDRAPQSGHLDLSELCLRLAFGASSRGPWKKSCLGPILSMLTSP